MAAADDDDFTLVLEGGDAEPATQDKESQAPISYVPPIHWRPFFAALLCWGIYALPVVRNFLATWWMYNVVGWGLALAWFGVGGTSSNRVDEKLGCKTDPTTRGDVSLFAAGMAAFVCYATMPPLSSSTWYALALHYTGMLLWFVGVLLSLILASQAGTHFDDEAAFSLLTSHSRRIPDKLKKAMAGRIASILRYEKPTPDASGMVPLNAAKKRLNAQQAAFYSGKAKVDESTSVVDTYTLEAALFGGLAFSSVVSLISSDKYQHDGFSSFIHGLLATTGDLLACRWKSITHFLHSDHGGADGVVLLLLLLSIFAAAFFLASLFCRIPFSKAHRECKVAYGETGRRLKFAQRLLRGRVVSAVQYQQVKKLLHGTERSLSRADSQYGTIGDIVAVMRGFRIAGLLTICAMLVAVCGRVDHRFGWGVGFLIAIGFSNTLGNPLSQLLGYISRATKRSRPKAE